MYLVFFTQYIILQCCFHSVLKMLLDLSMVTCSNKICFYNMRFSTFQQDTPGLQHSSEKHFLEIKQLEQIKI